MSEKHHEESPSNYNAWLHCVGWSGIKYDTTDSSVGSETHSQFDHAFKEEGYEPDSFVARWAVGAVRELAEDSKVSTEVRLAGTVPPVVGVYGTADAIWWKDGALNIADLKTFSDGTKDYTPQLMGYACLFATRNTPHYTRVIIHILHGGICKVESREFLLSKCKSVVRRILERKRGCDNKRTLCDYCSTCSKVKECKETMNALETVRENAVDGFGALSLCQKLVVLDAVDKLSATIREEAKRAANENSGILEMDGIRYEMKPWAGKPKVKDLCQLAGAIQNPVYNRLNKKEEVEEVGFKGLDNEQLLDLCELPKSKLVDALKKANADNKSIKKVEIERWVSAQYESTEGTPHFVRTK